MLCRIRHTHVLDDPFDDPAELASLVPEASPPPTFEQGDRLEDDWKPTEDTRAPEVIEEEIRSEQKRIVSSACTSHAACAWPWTRPYCL